MFLHLGTPFKQCALIALRNVLTYCMGAKVAATEFGYHEDLLNEYKKLIAEVRGSIASGGLNDDPSESKCAGSWQTHKPID